MASTLMQGSGKGYGAAGASLKRRAFKGFTGMSGSAREDIDFNNYTLRQRGRIMYMSYPIATSAVKTHRTNTIGIGLRLNPRPDYKFLGISPQAASEWKEAVKREFSLFADSKDACDATGVCNFYELQQMLVMSWLMTGDVFVILDQGKPTPFSPYTLRLRALEGDRVATPTGVGSVAGIFMTSGENPENGNRIYDGVEINSSGLPVAYWIRNTHPFEVTAEAVKFVRVKARGENTGLPNILQIMTPERPEQYRGVTYLAPVILQLMQISRYSEAELTAAIVNAMYTAFVYTEAADLSMMPFNEALPDGEGEGVSDDDNEYEMGPGVVNILKPGERVEFSPAARPAAGFEAFVNAVCSQIGSALEIPKEILLKEFKASYSASRAALLEAWKTFRMYRTWFANDFCDPVYHCFMTEAVARGRIKAPGFFTDPAVRKAWLNAEWIGPSQGLLDPGKEVSAEILACEHGFTTHEAAALRLNGSDFDSNVRQLVQEASAMEELKPAETGEGDAGEKSDGNEDDADERRE